MVFRKFGALALVGLIVGTSLAGYHAKAAIHPSVAEHLDNARIQAQLGKVEEAASYAEAMLMGGKITVSVDYGDTPVDQMPQCDEAVKGAFEMWQKALDGDVSFERVEYGQPADVKIKFDQHTKLNNQIVSGYINWSRTVEETTTGPKPHFKADVFLRTTDPSGHRMTAKTMRHTCGHEFGHMFGLDDVKEVGMLMGPLDIRHPVSCPGEAEVETVKAIRAECQSLVQAAKASTGSHAEHFAADGSIECDHH
ncbi:MAG: matrixin family metalloprotease [Armatimonadetes bacterium]|nr:matrixin family metalloprotease [Armatimonadota bacterium]MBS1702774.1 matrixin family metalloprotease [Armatimonadota bacterium]MBS1727160.1 matrixin family metalloprotease [Armatimonadota bacterium]